jgi:hypothetical protein
MNNYVLLSDKKRDIDNALLLISIKSFKDSSSVFGMQFVLERQLAFPVILFLVYLPPSSVLEMDFTWKKLTLDFDLTIFTQKYK